MSLIDRQKYNYLTLERMGGEVLQTKVTLTLAIVLSVCLPRGAAADVSYLNGGAAKNVLTVVSDEFSAAKSTFSLLPGAARAVHVPAGGDTVVVTFTAECFIGMSYPSTDTWLEVEIRDNNVPITPTGENPQQLVFCTLPYSSNSVQAVKRLAPGSHAIGVFYKLHYSYPQYANADLDDWTLTIKQFE